MPDIPTQQRKLRGSGLVEKRYVGSTIMKSVTVKNMHKKDTKFTANDLKSRRVFVIKIG